MTKKEKQQVAEICRILNETYGTDYKCYLNHENAWQLLIATMLSAQCTDARVNIVTKDLFVKYPTAVLNYGSLHRHHIHALQNTLLHTY